MIDRPESGPNHRACVAFLLYAAVILAGRVIDPQTRNGPRIVDNPVDPVPRDGRGLDVTLTEELRIGDDPSSGDSRFAVLRTVLADERGNIIAFDSREVCFKIFDGQGRFVGRFDEISRPMGIMLSKDGRIAVLDSGNNRLAYYALDGTCVERWPLKTVRPMIPVLDGRGRITGTVLSFAVKPRAELVRFTRGLDAEKTLATIVLPKENEIPPAELMERFIYQIRADDSIVWADNFRYELNVADSDGNPTLRASRAAKPKKLTRELLIEEGKKRYPGTSVPDAFRIPAHYPASFPFFEAFVCDDEGRIFVRTFEAVGTGKVRYDVFDASGLYVARFEIPDEEDIAAIKGGRAYILVKEDEKGTPIIKRCKLSLK